MHAVHHGIVSFSDPVQQGQIMDPLEHLLGVISFDRFETSSGGIDQSAG
jgi:hypothetical protein